MRIIKFGSNIDCCENDLLACGFLFDQIAACILKIVYISDIRDINNLWRTLLIGDKMYINCV